MDKPSDYQQWFYGVVTMGWVCGLTDPVEIIINAYRTPGATLGEEYYERMRKHIPRFLYEAYEYAHLCPPSSAADILEYVNNHYPEHHLCRDFFEPFKQSIQNYVDGKSDT